MKYINHAITTRMWLIVASAAIIQSCNNSTADADSNNAEVKQNTVQLNEAQERQSTLAMGNFIRAEMSEEIVLNGKIEVPPQHQYTIMVPMSGYLKQIKALVGMPVKKGEILATLEDQQYIQLQQDYLTTKAQLEFLSSEYERQQELNKSKATSDKILEQSKANYASQRILLKALEQKLKLIGIPTSTLTVENITSSIQIVSPVDGFVTVANSNTGRYVQPGDELFELIDPRNIQLNLTAYDKDLNKLSIGQKVLASTNFDTEHTYQCTILLISKNLDTANSGSVRCQFDTYDKTLIPGTFMNARVMVGSGPAYSLPEEAVVRYENKQYIFINKGKQQYEMVEVQVGTTEEGRIQVLGPSNVYNESVVIKGAYTLLMALKNVGE